jgi:crotonobetainyl-CoA:carnitine CoA-transferase CaiB-like acyl-CoA transferase
VAVLNAAGIACGPINAIDQVFADPQVQHLGLRWPVALPGRPDAALVRPPFRLSRHPLDEPPAPAPQQGDHTDEILRGLGYGDERIAALRAQCIV